MSKMNKEGRIATNATFLTISKTIALLVSMIISMILSRVCSYEEYGTFSQLILVVNLFASIFMLGLPNSLNYFINRIDDSIEKRKFLFTYFVVSTSLSIVMGVTLFLATPLFIKYFDNSMLSNVAVFFLIYPWASVITSNIENLFIAYEKTAYLNIYRVISSLLLILSVIIPILLGWNFKLYVFLYLIVNSILAISVYYFSVRLSGGFSFKFSFPLLKQTLVYSMPIGLASIVGTLSLEMDKLLIGHMMSTEELAIYTNAAKELPVTVISTSISAVLIPQIVKYVKNNKESDAILLWSYSIELSFIFICIISLGVFVFAEDVMTLLYSNKYLAGASVFRVYSIVLLFRTTYFGTMLSSIGRTKPIFVCSLLSLVLNFILNYLFYKLWGSIGPAIATLISISLTGMLQLIFTCSYTSTRFGKIFPWEKLFNILIINLIIGIGFYFLKKIIPLDLYISSALESIIMGILWSILTLLIFKKRILLLWKILNNAGEENKLEV